MQYVTIKQEERDGRLYFVVNAIPLKNTGRAVVQKIPHPLGTDILEFSTLEEAKEAVTRAGFPYILPDGVKGSKASVKQKIVQNGFNYDKIVLDTVKSKINSSNSNVSASAILALAEFPGEETFDILFSKIGEDNELIRKNAITGICRYPKLVQDRLINSLKSSNWVERNSALVCISNLADLGCENLEKFILPLTDVCEDSNTIVQAYALTVVAKVYQSYQKNKRV